VQEGCSPCAAGKYSGAAGLLTCTLCPIGTYSAATGATALSTCSPCLDSENALPADATYALGNYAPEGSTGKSACVNTRSTTCSNVPIGAELLFDHYLTCGACTRFCEPNNMLTGTCTDAGTGTTCTPCEGDCRMDMTFSTDLYMTKTDFSAAKAALFLDAIKDSMKVPLTYVSIVSITESSTTLVRSKYITVTAKVRLSNVAYLPESTLTSRTPAFIASALKIALITNGLTTKVADAPWADFARFGTHFTDKGTVLAISQPTHTKVEGIFTASPTQPRVQMKVELPYTKASFDETAQAKFKSAVANAVSTPADNIFINSVTEVTSSRRVSRKLLAVSVQVDFYILVKDEAASKALVSSGNLDMDKLNSELDRQVFPSQTASRGWHLRKIGTFAERPFLLYIRLCACACTDSAWSAIQTGSLPHLQGTHETEQCYRRRHNNNNAKARFFVCCSSCGARAGPAGVCRDLGCTADDEILRRLLDSWRVRDRGSRRDRVRQC
jgi:hypothetical protein